MRALFLSGGLLLAGVSAFGQMCANGVCLSDTIQDAGGSNAATYSADGSVQLDWSLGQPAPVGALGQTAEFVSGGFWGSAGSGGSLPTILNSMSLFGVAQPLLINGNLVGVPYVSTVTLAFSGEMIASALAQAITVMAIRDYQGNALSSPTAFGFAYNSNGNLASISPAGAPWQDNAIYQVAVSTSALDYNGQPLSSPVTFYFQTLANPATNNVFTGFTDTTAKVMVASGTYSQPYMVKVTQPLTQGAGTTSTSLSDGIVASEAASANAKAPGPVIMVRDVAAYDASGNPLPPFTPGQVEMYASYTDALQPGFVDGFGTAARTSQLAVYTLNETSQLWTRLPTSSVNTSAQQVSVALPHFSGYAVIASVDQSVADAYAYPVPFRPHGPQAGTGPGRTGTDAEGITFAQLPETGSIDVYNVRGEKVWHGDIGNGSGVLSWNTSNSSGQLVASGVYVYVITSPQDKKLGKLAIIR